MEEKQTSVKPTTISSWYLVESNRTFNQTGLGDKGNFVFRKIQAWTPGTARSWGSNEKAREVREGLCDTPGCFVFWAQFYVSGRSSSWSIERMDPAGILAGRRETVEAYFYQLDLGMVVLSTYPCLIPHIHVSAQTVLPSEGFPWLSSHFPSW